MAVAATVAALAFGACGQDDRQQVVDLVGDVQAAFADGDLRQVCDLMTPAARSHVGSIGHAGATCPSKLRGVARALRADLELRPVPPPTVERVRVDGDRAIATVESAIGAVTEVPFTRVDGDWRLNAFYGDIPAERQTDKF